MRIRKLSVYSGSELAIGWSEASWKERVWRKHVIDRPGALLSVRNEGEISFGGASCRLAAGDMAVFDALPRHEFRHEREWFYYYFHFPARMLKEEWSAGNYNCPVPGVRVVHFTDTGLARIKRELQEAHIHFELQSPGWEEMVGALMQLALTRFFHALPREPENGKSRLEQLLPRLGVYGNSENLEELAKSCGMSRTSFFRKFRTKYGCSPIEYRDNQVIARAQILLSSTELQVKEIARELNFRDPYYFTRFFHSHTGNTPTQYRKINAYS